MGRENSLTACYHVPSDIVAVVQYVLNLYRPIYSSSRGHPHPRSNKRNVLTDSPSVFTFGSVVTANLASTRCASHYSEAKWAEPNGVFRHSNSRRDARDSGPPTIFHRTGWATILRGAASTRFSHSFCILRFSLPSVYFILLPFFVILLFMYSRALFQAPGDSRFILERARNANRDKRFINLCIRMK